MKRRRPTEEELERDIADHIAMETEDNMARGMSPAEARYAALRKFGNITRVKEDTRSVWGWVPLETWCADVRHALRRMRRSPGTAALAVLSLAPFLWMVLASFKSLSEVEHLSPFPSIWHPENYAHVFQQIPFAHYYFNSVFVSAWVTFLQVLTSSMAAL